MAEMFQEKWMKGVAVTTTILAVATAIAASRGAACGAKTQLLTAIEGSKWAYYQAKSIKESLAQYQANAFEVERLGSSNPQQQAAYDDKLKTAQSEIARYEKEKGDIKEEAEKVGIENTLLGRKAN